jgi:RNA polymerase sigma factor (sigma-70 family)
MRLTWLGSILPARATACSTVLKRLAEHGLRLFFANRAAGCSIRVCWHRMAIRLAVTQIDPDPPVWRDCVSYREDFYSSNSRGHLSAARSGVRQMVFATGQSSAPPWDVVAVASSEGKYTIESVGLAELHLAHRGRLHRYFARNGAKQDADDLVQDSFLRFAAVQAKSPDKVVERPEAYLTTIAVNLLRERARVAARRSTASHIPADKVVLIGSDTIAALEARDELERVQASLARLSPKARSVFIAHRRDGLSYKEIARREGLSEKGVQKRMSKAIANVSRAKAAF